MTERVILDLDGPVLDGRDRHYECYREILSESHRKPLPVEIYWDLKRNKTPLREVLKQTGADDILGIFQRDWLARIEEMRFLKLDIVWPGVEAAIKNVRLHGWEVTLVTKRQSKTKLMQQLESLGLASCFDQVIVTGLEQHKSEMLKTHLPGAVFSRAIWIGDTELDIQEARETGAFAWTVTCGLRSPQFLESYRPDRMFPDLCSALRELPL